MRHEKRSKKLSRQRSHLKATLKSLARAVFFKESIRTTHTKAKVAKSYVDKLITIAKCDTPVSKRHVFSLLRDKKIINILFNDIAPRFKSRNGGYTRVIPLYPRRGDGSPMAILELVEKKPKVETGPKKGKKATKEAAKEPIKLKKIDLKKKAEKDEKPESKEKTLQPDKEIKKEEHKAAPEPKASVRKEIEKERAKDEDKKAKKGNIFKNIRTMFRHKKP